MLNRERPVYIIVSPEERAPAALPGRRGRPLRDALALLADASAPDPAFAEDMERVLEGVGPNPDDPWARS